MHKKTHTHRPLYPRRSAAAIATLLIVALVLPLFPQVTSAVQSSWNPTLIINTEAFQIIDDLDAASNIQLKFGETLSESILYDRTNSRFKFSRGLFVSGTLTATGSVNASGALITNGDITLNSDNGAADATLNFGNATASQFLKLANATQAFQFSKKLTVSGSLTVQGAMSGQTLQVSGLKSCTNGVKTDANGATSCIGAPAGGISQSDADARYVNTSTDTMTGTLTINATTANLVKTTSGRTLSTDFLLAGASVINVMSQSGYLMLSKGGIPSGGSGTFSTSTVVTAVAAGTGALSILEGSGGYAILHGGRALTASLWDGKNNVMRSVTATVTTGVGSGAIALRRPDGRYLIVHGNGTTNSSLFDPNGITAAAAGPTLTSCTAQLGTSAFQIPGSGAYVILCGKSKNWGVYNPTLNTYKAGAAIADGTPFGSGSFALDRDDGTFIVFAGAGTTTHWIYNSLTGTWGTANPIASNAPTIAFGANAIRRADGTFLIIGGARLASAIYDPTRTAFNSGAGSFTSQAFGPTTPLKGSAIFLWRQDDTYLLITGSGTVTNIVNPSKTDATQFSFGPALPGKQPGGGLHAVMRADGRYQIIIGSGTTTTWIYDTGFVRGGANPAGAGTTGSGSYETECMTATSLGSGSRLFWTQNQGGQVNMQVRTGNGSCTAAYKDVRLPGDLIRPSAGHNRVQVRAIFARPAPSMYSQDWNMWLGRSQPRYRHVQQDPTVYDITVDNSQGFHRTNFHFGLGTGNSGSTMPVATNMQTNTDGSISLATGVGVGTAGFYSTNNSTNNILYNGAFLSHQPLLAAAGSGTVAVRRPDGKFMIIAGNTTANAQIYDPVAQTFIQNATTATKPGAPAGKGALTFKMPNGKFFIVLGNGTTKTTIYDPVLNTFSSGAALTGNAGRGAVVIPLPTGNVLIAHGGALTTTSIYNPLTNTMVAGPSPTAAVGPGAMAIPNPGGTYLFIPGVVSDTTCATLNTVTNRFDPYTMTFSALGAPALVTGVGPGAFAFQRSDGQWVIVKGGATATAGCGGTNATMIYNPVTNKIAAGPVLSGQAQQGAYALPRPDGTMLVVHGGTGATATSIYQEKAGAFTTDLQNQVGVFVAGPTLLSGTRYGGIAFQRADGKFVQITGNSTTAVNVYDGGWVEKGLYRTEPLYIPDLDGASTLTWKPSSLNTLSGISAKVRTATTQQGLMQASFRQVATPGGPINPASGENWLQVTFTFDRNFPSYSGMFEDVWYNGGSPNLFPYFSIPTPYLTEFRINKDKDLLLLKADGRALFRVNTNGDLYTSPTSSLNVGGADIAERYSSTQDLRPGEVVSADPAGTNSIVRSTMAEQTDMLGVISTQPGFVAGSSAEHSFPVALAGRVPVQVTDQNGLIKVGDRLTSSDVPGMAMKATGASLVLGMAIENMDPQKLTPCPGTIGRMCGTLTIFVKLSDWPGPKKGSK